MVAVFSAVLKIIKINVAFCLKMLYIVSMSKTAKIKNEINVNIRVDETLMNRIKKSCAKKWNISISVFARQALKNFCEIIEKE